MKKQKVAILGATGAVGQTFVRLLERHPQFEVTEVVAGDANVGKPYIEAVRWLGQSDVPRKVASLQLKSSRDELDAEICFSALPSGQAGDVERRLAASGRVVFTNATDLRMHKDVPLVIPEVNPGHLALIDVQKRASGSDGFVVANGNCTAIVMTLPLKPLADAFGLEHVSVTSLQSISGAGFPGVPSYEILDNVIPYIGGREEDKMVEEPQKFLGALHADEVVPAEFPVSATCTRVPVIEGHTVAVHVRLKERVTPEQVATCLTNFRGKPQELGLPTAPARPILVRDEADRPQPRKDLPGAEMVVSVGRIRRDSVFDVKFVAVGSPTVRGAAGASILNAELCAALGYL